MHAAAYGNTTSLRTIHLSRGWQDENKALPHLHTHGGMLRWRPNRWLYKTEKKASVQTHLDLNYLNNFQNASVSAYKKKSL